MQGLLRPACGRAGECAARARSSAPPPGADAQLLHLPQGRVQPAHAGGGEPLAAAQAQGLGRSRCRGCRGQHQRWRRLCPLLPPQLCRDPQPQRQWGRCLVHHVPLLQARLLLRLPQAMGGLHQRLHLDQEPQGHALRKVCRGSFWRCASALARGCRAAASPRCCRCCQWSAAAAIDGK